MTDLLIIGGGAAGLMAAGAACARGLAPAVVEHNPKGPGQKLLITGKGRCNVTNDCDVREFLNYVRHNPRFLYSALYAFSPASAMELFESLGVPLKTERGRRVFPQSDRAADVLAALRSYAADAEFVHGSAKELLIEDGRCVGVRTSDGKTHRAAHVLVTTGGTSYPATGSDGSGYKLARQAGHTIVPPQPSLCSLVSPDPACRQMMGLSLRNVTLTLLKDGKPLFTEQGEALFTHFGISGPLVLSASTYIDDVQLHRYIAEFDLKPALDEKTLYDRLTRDFAALGGHSAQGALEKLLPNSMRPVAVKKWGVDPATRAAQITREQKMALVHLCKHWQVPISELGDKEHAVITAGGVDVREVDPKTMASKLCGGLLAVLASTKKADAAYQFIEYANHGDGVATRVAGGAFPADKASMESDSFKNTTTVKNADGEDVDYFGGQKYNEVLAQAAENVSSDYQFLPYEVKARTIFGDYLGKSYTGDQKLTDGISAWQKALQDYGKDQGFPAKQALNPR